MVLRTRMAPGDCPAGRATVKLPGGSRATVGGRIKEPVALPALSMLFQTTPGLSRPSSFDTHSKRPFVGELEPFALRRQVVHARRVQVEVQPARGWICE